MVQKSGESPVEGTVVYLIVYRVLSYIPKVDGLGISGKLGVFN